MPDNSRLVFSQGNQWTDDDTAPYFVLPSAWRRFIFQVLTPRELAVYLYISSLTDRHAIAYPTTQQIAEDLGVRSRQTVNSAVDRLTELGFLLKMKQEKGFLRGRNVYQRPAPQYTLLQLLSGTPLIDAELYPTDSKRTDATASSDGAVQAHLQKLLGSLYMAYVAAKPERRLTVLTAVLLERLDGLMTEAKNKRTRQDERQAQKEQRELDDLPEHIRNMMVRDEVTAVVYGAAIQIASSDSTSE